MTSRNNGFLGLTVALAFVATGVLEIPASAAETSSTSSNVSAGNSGSNVPGGSRASSVSSCPMTASSTWIFPGQTSALTAVPNPAAASYVWTGGTCADTRSATCTVRPAVTTTYTVSVFNSSGAPICWTGEVTVEVSRFSPAPLMMASRSSHSATLLPNGKVLVAGGVGVVGGVAAPLASTEIYDPASNTWSNAGSMLAGRARHTATLLPNGKVLVVGGNNSASSEQQYLASAEVYDPASDTWSSAGSMLAARVFHAATLLPNGKVLVMGGHAAWPTDCSYYCDRAFSSVEAYDPASNTWSSAIDMLPRDWLTATLLPNGKVLALGGYECTRREVTTGPDPHFYLAFETCSQRPQLYDPISNTWSEGAYRDFDNPWGTGILRHTATLLPSGRVLAAGGEACGSFECDSDSPQSIDVELYDPTTNTWSHNPYDTSYTGYPNYMSTGRLGHSATLLPSGKVLVAGGGQDRWLYDSADIYDPWSNTWSSDGRMTAARAQHTATLLPNGRVLLTGGGSSEFYGEVVGEQTPPERVDLPVDSASATTPGNKAIVMTHGWNSDVNAWPVEMANDLCSNGKIGVLVSTTSPAILDNRLSKICQVKAPNNDVWDIWVLDWRAKAVFPPFLPSEAYSNANPIGHAFGTDISAKNYSYIHLIAHSAGSNLIHSATKQLKYLANKNGLSAPTIHETFLDAYDPFLGITPYGEQADWADSYVDLRDVVPVGTKLDGTKLLLPKAYNINTTPNVLLDPCLLLLDASNPWAVLASPLDVINCRHNRPVRFYGLSIISSFVGDGPSAWADKIASNGTGTLGYPLSEENGHTLIALNKAYPPGKKCVMDGSTCYPGSLPPSVLAYLPSAVATTVVDTVTGTVNYVAGVGTTLFNVIRFGAGLVGGANVAPMTASASAVPTESPSSIVVLATTTQPVNTIRFNWRFATAGEGYLRVLVDGNLVRELDQRHVPLASTTTEEVYIGGPDGMLPAGTHRIAFRLDGFGASASGVELTNIELGLGLNEDFLTTGTVPTGWVQPTGSVAPWTVATDAANAGTFSLKSGTITHSQKSELSYSANFLAGNVSFARKVSSESCCDYLQFYVDGVLEGAWSGELDWAVVSFPMSAGPHTLLWRYLKDSSISTGSDAAWIDSVTLPGVVAPVAQSISFGPAPMVEIGGTGSVSATATSGLAVSLRSTSSGVCTIAGTVVSGVAVGLCTIAATQVGDGVYAPAAEVLLVFSVTGVLTTPGAPSIVSITPGPGRVTLILLAPGNTGGGAIVSYSATCSASGHPSVTATSTTTTVVVPGLVPGVSYACTATASNGSYNSTATAAASAIPKPKADLTPILMLLLD